MPQGRLVVFEGIDGSGKSSALASVAKAVPGVVTAREETDGPTGEWVRRAIADRMDPLATTFLFLADRAQHVPWLRRQLQDRDVLCDRFLHSTLAYQSVTLASRMPDPLGFLRRLHEPLDLQPDHVLLFRADPGRCVARTRARGATTPYEKVEFLERVQEAYLRLAEEDPRVLVLDAERDLQAVTEDAIEIVRDWLAS